MGEKPKLTGKIQNNDSDNFGDSALWVVDSDNDDAPRLSGALNLNAGRLRELLENNPDANEITLRLSLWDNE